MAKAKKVTFRGAHIRGISLSRDTGGVYITVNMRADYSSPLQQQMNWQDYDETLTSGKLKGRLPGKTVSLTPNSDFKKFAIDEMAVEEARDFQYACVKNENDGVDHVVNFAMTIRGKDLVDKLDRYWQSVGYEAAVLVFTCGEEAEQTTIADAEPTKSKASGGVE